MLIVALLGFAALMSFFAYSLVQQRRETASDCALESVQEPRDTVWPLLAALMVMAVASAMIALFLAWSMASATSRQVTTTVGQTKTSAITATTATQSAETAKGTTR